MKDSLVLSTTLFLGLLVSASVLTPFAVSGGEASEVTGPLVVIIQAAGVIPGSPKPEETDAITHATTKDVNTYTLSDALAERLRRLGARVEILPYQRWAELSPRVKGGNAPIEALVFAGPSYSSKLPKQLRALFPELRGMLDALPNLRCSCLVAAWFPETKGATTIADAERAFRDAGAAVVPGIAVLTPKKNQPGAAEEDIQRILDGFAARLLDSGHLDEGAPQREDR